MFKWSFSLQSSHVVMASRFVANGGKNKNTLARLDDQTVFSLAGGGGGGGGVVFRLPELILEHSHLLMHSW